MTEQTAKAIEIKEYSVIAASLLMITGKIEAIKITMNKKTNIRLLFFNNFIAILSFCGIIIL